MMLEVTNETLEEQFDERKKEAEKVKKESLKNEKVNGLVVKELKEELGRSFAEVKRVTEAITKMEEEKKTLLGIHKVNIDLQEQIKSNNKSKVSNDEVTISDCEDEDDEESVAFNMMQNRNRFRRTSPVSEAVKQNQKDQSGENLNNLICRECSYKAKNETNLRGHMSGHNISCEKCHCVFKTAEMMRQHIRNVHVPSHVQTESDPKQNTGPSPRLPCHSCDFTAKTTVQLKKHEEIKHSKLQRKIPCDFWLRGFCRFGQSCKFSHESTRFCKFQDECVVWPNCTFEHSEMIPKMPCHYQENCLNTNCKFEHFKNHFEIGKSFWGTK